MGNGSNLQSDVFPAMPRKERFYFRSRPSLKVTMYSSGTAGNPSETAVSFECAGMVLAELTNDVARRRISRVRKDSGTK
jgi:hypothetical protein